ncbi:glutathione S-transferase L3-like isoform X1 [Juglans microcarpa x Juglans regia]|uniref:glutathione S-transferase L3-like isoform X1 n=1 Tax=Juglans microcarpa x Juglans regia TaxID=2249226 RepID=UPI001B7F3838|nr:glutathione S-transferase L3-like isoform X1 [Juglans microcarpa x Juglans regia]
MAFRTMIPHSRPHLAAAHSVTAHVFTASNCCTKSSPLPIRLVQINSIKARRYLGLQTNTEKERIRSLRTTSPSSSSLAAASVQENLPPSLDATSEPPPLFDGTTRLYIAYVCPFAQRAWITRNYKGLQDSIKLVAINLQSRPAWYKEKVYAANTVPSLEHNGKIIGESLDVIKYLDSNFEGPSLSPNDPAKKEFAEELIAYTDTFTKTVFSSFKGDPIKESGPVFDHIEEALHKFDDGPFFLGQFSLVDIAFITFFERFQIFFSGVWKHDITAGRPKLAKWIEEVNKIDAYKQTKIDPNEHLETFKARFLAK